MELPLDLATKWSRLLNWYKYLTLHVVPEPSSLSFLTLILLLPTALMIPPSVLSHHQLKLLFVPILLAYGIQTWQTNGVLDVITTTGLQWSFVLLTCYNPRRDFKRVWWEPTEPENDDGKDQDARFEVREQAYPEKFVERIPWVLTLLVSIRLAGWKTGSASHDKTQPIPPSMTRIAFLGHAMKICVLNYILLDVSAFYALTDPYFTTSGMSVDAPFHRTALLPGIGGSLLGLVQKLPPRLVRCGTLAAQSYGLIASGYYPLTFPVVGLNALGLVPDVWSPHTWPLFFGSFSAILARGTRGLWGTWWHQMNRQIHATPGRALVSAMGVDKNSFFGRMIVTLVAFGLSGWMHMGLIPPEPLSRKVTAQEMRLTVAAFFWHQPLAFASEYTVAAIVQLIAPQVKAWPVAKFGSLVWVAAWLCLTLPLLTVPFRELGYWTVYPIPFSILSGLAGNDWWRWF